MDISLCFTGIPFNDLRVIRQHRLWGGRKAQCTREQQALAPRRFARITLSLRSSTDRTTSNDLSKWTKEEFDSLLSKGELQIAFVGMSNCGKSHRSNQLRVEHDFDVFCVDDEIERVIAPELQAMGYEGIEGLAAWMGFPTDDRFAENQGVYLQHEESITAGAQKKRKGRNFALDTTGSVVYLSEETRKALRDDFLIVHLEAADDMMLTMVENYFASPKPVVWGNSFDRREDEDAETALRRCYPRLLRERRKKYAELAHVTIPGTVSLDRNICCNEFLRHLRDSFLPSFAPKAVGT